MERREVIQRRIAQLEEELAQLDQFPQKDPFNDGAVIMFDKTFENDTRCPKRVYTYVALRADGRWYITNKATSHGITWESLVKFMTEGLVGEVMEAQSFEPLVVTATEVKLYEQVLWTCEPYGNKHETTGSRFHRVDHRIGTDRSRVTGSRLEARNLGLKPCHTCFPEEYR